MVEGVFNPYKDDLYSIRMVYLLDIFENIDLPLFKSTDILPTIVLLCFAASALLLWNFAPFWSDYPVKEDYLYAWNNLNTSCSICWQFLNSNDNTYYSLRYSRGGRTSNISRYNVNNPCFSNILLTYLE